MYILPYILKQPKASSSNFNLWTAWVFMAAGGKEVWKTDEDVISTEQILADYLIPNGFVGTVKKVVPGEYLLFEVDMEKSDIGNLYTWSEFLDKQEEVPGYCNIFRPFIWVGETKIGEKDDWGWYEECEQISVGPMGTVADVLKLLSGV